MVNHFKNLKKTCVIAGTALILGLVLYTFAQAQVAPVPLGMPRVERVRIGPHPEYTRILIDLSAPVTYKVKADFTNNRITLSLDNSVAGPRARSRTFRDKNLEQVLVRSIEGKTKIDLMLKNTNTRFFHFTKSDPSQIVVDLEGRSTPVLRTRIGPKGVGKRGGPKQEEVTAPKVAGLTKEDVTQAIRQDIEDKLKEGWEDYKAALIAFQKREYPAANKLFRAYIKKYPDSRYLPDIMYLLAESRFRIAFKEPNPIYEKALASYQLALRTFPKSRFADHALYKIAFIFDEMGYTLEAKTLYEQGIKRDRRSLYNSARKIGLAQMLMKEKRYEEAYDAFQLILKRSPKSPEAKTALFDIAGHYFQLKDYKRAIEVYENAARRWSADLAERPDINFNMGEIYFAQKRYTKARKHFFDLINLSPDAKLNHKALNRVGDSYILEGRDLEALSVFDESNKKNPGSSESQYGQIRMADIGVRNPRLEVRDIIFNVDPYYEPLRTYDRIEKSAKSVDILAEVTLSRGISFLKEQSYLKAIEQFKKLLPLGPESPFFHEAQKYISQALVLVVERYSRQGGTLPILYSYNDFIGLSLGKVRNLKTLLQIGEAYQAIGMYPQAVRFYDRVKALDSRESYSDRIFLNLGNIHLEQKNFQEAELVALSFLKNYPRSKRVPSATKLLAKAYKGQGKIEKALETYKSLLKKRGVNLSEIHYLKGDCHLRLEQYPLAIEEFRKSIETFDRTAKIIPDYIPEAYYQLGATLHITGEYERSVEALGTARQLFPEHPLKDWADFLIAESFKKMENSEQAVSQLTRLAESKDGDDLLKNAAQSILKVMDWEKQFKGTS